MGKTKTIRLGNRLRYPITIVRLLKNPGDTVKKQDALMEYSFKWYKEVGDTIRGETWEEEQTTYADWSSPSDGTLNAWSIKEGQVIKQDGPCVLIDEDCSHEIQFQGLCAICGKDMTEANWAAETRDTERAPISMVHDQTNLTVSSTHAQKSERELQKRLLESRKLSLVVDLDQTVIQACIDPTVGEWMKDPTNPNYDSVKNVKTFQLDDGPHAVVRKCWYYIKMRPGLEGFLKRISTMYELHVYTMGTRAYAQNVARVIDPEKKLFGNRVISRDENGNMYSKSLQRLFPVSTNMVVIIDDRSDVWPHNRPNLVKVTPYEFFKGIGDINASFLPKRQDLLTSAPSTNGVKKAEKTADKNAKAVATGKDTDEVTKEQLEEQQSALEKQINERPLQLLQEKQDKEDEEAEKATGHSDDSASSRSSSPPPQRHKVLLDDDRELEFLEKHLTQLHKAYYASYDQKKSKRTIGEDVPDVGNLLNNLKAKVLRGHQIALSGVLPQNTDIYRSEIGQQITSFGARLRSTVSKEVTHLVVNTSQPGTAKLNAARRYPHIKVVGLEWLAQCFTEWTSVDETPYLYFKEDVNNVGAARQAEESSDDNDEDMGGIETGNTAPKTPQQKRNKLQIQLPPRGDDQDDDDADDDEDGLLPDEVEEGQMSPIDGLKTFNWGSAEDELAEFLASGSDDDDDDEDMDEEDEEDEEDDEDFAPPDESESSSSSEESSASRKRSRSRSGSPATRKRKLEDDVGDGEEDGNNDDEGEENSPAKRMRRMKSARGSSLRHQYEAAPDLPTPAVTGDEDGVEDKVEEEGQNFTDLDEEALAADLEAEFAADLEAEFNSA
ncbi:uncharacterized protein PODANS_5_6570 [Podospora anserina S mat+]|uniref:RNA polymerase II subunit A C-terminal domain phosphatase n=1 Tax=Podospora anserina (strain S / ATCC MYA-4624 / DSM 980 / FGSC 10383) TaxID=515849 RepID=B2AM81_PODAN|nr:uncharacterized protein PODANS_5_6570 [Podospora anserina S mat+]CAP65069.1 unnamed protein product [Podospora anserina S mat+]CDP29839.1 Putative RNA polymerase II subunit A C-terminal domain phosphatase [Podospora anserina S mat+]